MKKCPYCAEEIRDEALKCKHCGCWVESPPEPPTSPATAWIGRGAGPAPAPAKGGGLHRSSTNKMLAGVCAGIASYLGIDPVWVRIVYPIATFFTGILPGVVLYILLAVVVPSDDALLS